MWSVVMGRAQGGSLLPLPAEAEPPLSDSSQGPVAGHNTFSVASQIMAGARPACEHEKPITISRQASHSPHP